ncbi:MAG: hypothetical protein GY937_20575 [bacterium]|nr:hypothetical protein [bacterium]
MNYSAMVNNTCAFHFVPGCEGNNVVRKFRCQAGGRVVSDLVSEALNHDDLVRFGVVLHAYADSFSHQGFAGIVCRVNDIVQPRMIEPRFHPRRIVDGIRLLGRRALAKVDQAIPPYGHAQALAYPDMSHLAWSYKYDATEKFTALDRDDFADHSDTHTDRIDNRQRFKDAFERISVHLKDFLQKHPTHRDALMFDGNGAPRFDGIRRTLFETLLSLSFSEKGKEKNWIRVLKDETLGLFDEEDAASLEYSSDLWLSEAFANYDKKRFDHRTVDGAVVRVGEFEKSNWYRFYEAVGWYKRIFHGRCRAYGLELPNDY